MGALRRLMLRLSPLEGRQRTQQEIEAILSNTFVTIPGARITLSGEAPGSQLVLALVGNDPALLESAAQAVARDLRGVPRNLSP